MGIAWARGQSIAIDNSGNVYTSGNFNEMADFDPTIGVYNLVGAFGGDIFVHKMSNCSNAATITTQPLNQLACPDANAIFSVSASQATAYQWQYSSDGGTTYSNISGATASIYTITSVSASQNGYRYRCVVSGECNVITSAAATLTTGNSITVQPQNVNACANSSPAFSVSATGAIISYQWQLSIDGGVTFNDIAGANASTYILTSLTTGQQGYQFRCVVTGECNIITSSIAVLSVGGQASIISHPLNTEVCSGGSASFSVSVTNILTTSYQWEMSADGGINYFPVVNSSIYSGATTSVLTITGVVQGANNYRYRCKLSDSICNSSISNAAILIVRKLPAIELTASPFTSLFPWQSATLTATFSGTGGVLSTTWNYNNSIIPNTGNSSTVNFDQIGSYQVQINERWPSDLVCTNRSSILAITARDTARLIIYPNPNHGQFRISYYNPSGVSDLQVVRIYDSKGAMVYRSRFTLTGIYTLIDISRLSLSAGSYSVVIGSINGERITVGKLIVY